MMFQLSHGILDVDNAYIYTVFFRNRLLSRKRKLPDTHLCHWLAIEPMHAILKYSLMISHISEVSRVQIVPIKAS